MSRATEGMRSRGLTAALFAVTVAFGWAGAPAARAREASWVRDAYRRGDFRLVARAAGGRA